MKILGSTFICLHWHASQRYLSHEEKDIVKVFQINEECMIKYEEEKEV